jgi:very-short-patch-repair endonuclease
MALFYNRTEDKDKRQMLRRDSPPAERLLWSRLRECQVGGLRFRRQYGIGVFVLDLYCPSCKLAVELDGMSHDSDEAQDYDRQRQAFIESFGIRMLRFPNQAVFADLDTVVEQIACAARIPSSDYPLPSSPLRKGEG